MNPSNQLFTPDPRSTNDILDSIIAESGNTYRPIEYDPLQKNIFQRYGSSLLARRPLTIVLTILPVTMLVGASVLLGGTGQKDPIAGSEPISSSEEYAGSDNITDNEASTNENVAETENTGSQTQTTTSPNAVAAIVSLSGGKPPVPTSPTNPVVPTPPPTPQPPTPSPVTSTFGIASWNAYYGNSSSSVGNSVRTVADKGAQIIGLQEMHIPSKRKDVKAKLIDCSGCVFTGYVHNYTVDGSSAASVPIYWNKNLFTNVGNGGYVHVSNDTGLISNKWITYIKLKDNKTGRLFYVLNTHTVASVESLGKPTDTGEGRLANYKTHMDKMDVKLNELKKEGIPIFITGDFNVNYRYDKDVRNSLFPYARMAKHNIQSNWQSKGMPKDGTFKGSSRIIDYVFSLSHGAVAPNSSSVYYNLLGSDHYPVYFNLTLKK